MNHYEDENASSLITNAQVLERIRQSSKDKTAETARINVVIPRAFLRLNGHEPEMMADPAFYDRLERFLGDRDARKYGILLPARSDDKYIARVAALVPAYKSVREEEQYQAGPFPFTALNREQQRIVESLARVYEVPVELAAMAALAVTAAALGKGWKLTEAVKEKENYSNLYVIAALESGRGKAVADELAKPLVDACDRLKQEWETTELPRLRTELMLLTAKAKRLVSIHTRLDLAPHEMAAVKADLNQTNQDIERVKSLLDCSPRYIVGDATTEALAERFARSNDTLFAYSSEGGQILRVMLGKYGRGENADFDLWLCGYSVQRYTSDRISRRTVNVVPCLSALVYCQPTVLSDLWNNQEALERGLTGRVLAFECEVPLKEDDGRLKPVPEGRRKAWNELIKKLLSQREENLRNGGPHFVTCSPEARDVFREFHNLSIRLRNTEFMDVEVQLGRWRENACRLALGLCVADDSHATILSGQQADRAVQIARWAQLSALQLMRAEQDKRMAEKIERREIDRINRLRHLARAYDGGITLRALRKSHGFSQAEVSKLTEKFPQRLRLEARQNPKGGPLSLVLKATDAIAD